MTFPPINLNDVRFAYPYLLLLLLLLPLLWLGARRRSPTLRYANVRLVQTIGGQLSSWRITLRPLLFLLRLLAYALLILALARPQLSESRQLVRGEGVHIILSLDISGSMASLDFTPDNRLVAAKGVIEEFVAERTFDPIGLVVFAQEAFVQSPITIDHRVLGRFLHQIDLAPILGLDDGTAIGMGLATAASMLKNVEAKSKVIILLTDGVNNSGQIDPITAAQAAQALGIKVYTIGMGKTGLVPFPQPNFLGQTVITQRESIIDEATLQTIAQTTGGLYFRAEDTDGLKKIYEAINLLEKSEVEITSYTRYQELMAWVVWPAFALLVLERLLRETAFRTIP